MRGTLAAALLWGQAFLAAGMAAGEKDPPIVPPPAAAADAGTPKPAATPPGGTPSPAKVTAPVVDSGQAAPDQKPPTTPAESPTPGTPEAPPKAGTPGEPSADKSPAPDAGPPLIPPLPPLPTLPPLPVLPPLPGTEPLPPSNVPPTEPGPPVPGGELLLIPNGILPFQQVPLVPTPEVMGFKPAPPKPTAVEPVKPEEMKIPVTKFTLRYAPGQKASPRLPSIEQLQKVAVPLTEADGVLVPAAPKPGPGKNVSVRLDEASPKPRAFRGDAIDKLGEAVVSLIHKAGIYEVYVIPDPAQIDRLKGRNYDQRGGKTDLSILIYVSKIVEVRSLRQKPGAPAGTAPVIDSPKDARLRAKSPVGGSGGVAFLDKSALEDYLERVNRFPGREVETETAPAGDQHELILDFVVHEDKPISIYASTMNSGTPSTGIWRTRLGVEWKQLLSLDDVLRAEYVGAHLSDYYAGQLSYEFAPIFPDYLKFKAYGAYAKFSSEDIGYGLQNFEASTWIAGGQVTWTPVYIGAFPLDLNVGFEWMRVDVDHRNTVRDGQTDFALPYAGISTERRTSKFSLFANAQVEFDWFGLAGTQEADLPTLGRSGADRHFTLATWDLNGSVFLEPLLFGKAWDEQQVWWKSTRAHELAFSFHGQVPLDKARLAPELQMTVGGFDTVRGYPEALAAGDSVMVATAEYRFHVPREFFKLGGGGGHDARETQIPGAAFLPPKPGTILDPRFNRRSGSVSSGQDWDVILRGFFDFGETFDNKIDSESERNRTLASVGGGIEVQFHKPLFISLRLDVGCPLIAERGALDQRVDPGGVRFHMGGTISW